MTVVDLRAELPRADWNNGQATKTSVTVHWNGTPVPEDVADIDVIFGDAYYHLTKDWSDAAGVQPGDGIMYHRLYGRDGTVYLTRDPDDILWHCGNAVGNARSSAWQVMAGTGQFATAAQLAALHRDLALQPLPVNGHRDWSQTACPGDQLYAFIHDEEVEMDRDTFHQLWLEEYSTVGAAALFDAIKGIEAAQADGLRKLAANEALSDADVAALMARIDKLHTI